MLQPDKSDDHTHVNDIHKTPTNLLTKSKIQIQRDKENLLYKINEKIFKDIISNLKI